MRFVAIIAATVSILAIAGTAHDASAQAQNQARRAPAVSLTEAAQTPHPTTTPQRRGLRWNDSGRWGLNFNLNQPVGRETDWGDVEAGAYYRLSPRLRVGAAANLASPEIDPARAPESAADRRAAPRVRLETIFKF